MSGLEDRMRAAFNAELFIDEDADDRRPLRTALADAFAAAAAVLADELGGDKVDAAPVRPLPTEPGSVILASVVRDTTLQPPVRMMRLADRLAEDRGAPMWVSAAVIQTFRLHHDGEIGAWEPARVVRDDDEGPVAALRWIAEHQMPDLTLHEQIGAFRFKAGAALDGVSTHA